MVTNEYFMSWIKDTYINVKGEYNINFEGCCSEKHKNHGGIAERTENTGLGVFYAIKYLLNS